MQLAGNFSRTIVLLNEELSSIITDVIAFLSLAFDFQYR